MIISQNKARISKISAVRHTGGFFMSKNKSKPTKETETTKKIDKLTGGALCSEIDAQLKEDEGSIEIIKESWDEKERIFFGKTSDEISEDETKSKVYDPRLSSMAIERSSRVMAQVPTGKINAISKNNSGKNALVNVVFDKYILKNANKQYDILTKLRLWDLYSLIYGSMPVLADWVVSDSYIGPDFYLIPIRNFIPQSGVYQIEEMDRCFVRSEVTLGWLLDQPKKTWKNIDKIWETIGKDGEGKDSSGSDKTSWVEREFSSSSKGTGKFAKVELVTRYERDRWVTYAPDYDLILRDIDNPHKNNKLPIVVKNAFPLLDRFYGLGEFERGETLQKAINSLINLYLDGVKYSIFPPTIMNPNGVVPSSITYGPAANWLETTPNSIRPYQISPQGTNTFTSTYQFLNAALQNQGGTSDTTISSDTDVTQGKTPQALKMQAGREASRDNWDRFMMERSIEKLFDLMVNMVCVKQEKPIEIELFKSDIEFLAKTYPDVMEIYEDGEFGKAVVDKKEFQEMNFKYYIDTGTTLKKDEAIENQALTSILSLILQNQALAQQIPQGMVKIGNKVIDFGEAFKRWVITSGVQDSEKIVKDAAEVPQNPQMPQGQPGMPGMPPEMGPDMGQQMPGQPQMEQPQPQMPQEQMGGQFDINSIQNPEIRQMAEQLLNGSQQPGQVPPQTVMNLQQNG